MLPVMVVVAGCRCTRCWSTANYSSILMRGRKIGSRTPGIEHPGPERSKPKALTTALPCPLRYLLSSAATLSSVIF